MTLGVDPLASIAIAQLTGAGTRNPVVAAWDADSGRVMLYEVTAYKLGAAGSWITPVGTQPLGSIPDSATITGESTFRFSDVGYISRPGDSVPDTCFDGAVDSGLRLTRSTPVTPEASRRVTLDLGSFSIINADGDLDSIVRGYSIDGRRVRVLLGLSSYRYDQFTPIFTGRMAQWGNDLSKVNIVVRDESYRLEKPMQTDIYDGSGGYNGGADLLGKPRPMTFGQVLNVSPPLIDSANLIFQVHHRTIQSVDAVYDRGATITAGANYATYAALVAAVVSAGTYATCLTFGLIRLGSTPSGLITADIKGDASATYIDTTGAIGKRIIKDFGGLVDTELDLASYVDFEAGLPGTVGWWRGTDPINVNSALDEIMGHCAAWWGAMPDGPIQVGRLTTPSATLYTLALDESDQIKLEILDPLNGTFPPRFRQRVGYQKNWTPQQDTDLAGAVTAARRQFLAEGYRLVKSEDLTVQTKFQLAVDPEPLPSLFYNSSDASTLAASLLSLYGAARQTVRVTLDLKGLGARLSSTVLLTHPRLNDGVPTPMLLMDATIAADPRQTELVLWG
jgi:hypothetical protein